MKSLDWIISFSRITRKIGLFSLVLLFSNFLFFPAWGDFVNGQPQNLFARLSFVYGISTTLFMVVIFSFIIGLNIIYFFKLRKYKLYLREHGKSGNAKITGFFPLFSTYNFPGFDGIEFELLDQKVYTADWKRQGKLTIGAEVKVFFDPAHPTFIVLDNR